MQSFIQDPDSLAAPRTLRERRQDGSFVLRSAEALAPYGRCVGDWLEHWAVQTPQAIALAERAPDGGWREVTWRVLRQQVGAVAQALIDMDLPAGRPVVILSDNGIAHAVLALAAMHVGRPCCAVSSAYSRAGTDHGRLRAILAALKPALIFAADGAAHAAAMQTFDGAVKVVGEPSDHVPGALPFEALTRTRESPSVMARFLAITPDDPAKYLLTSGSTGTPKVVVNTHRMLCANQQMIAQAWRFLAVEKPVLLDWLPWSHTFGGNHNVHLVLRHGGTLYIDDGRPVPGLIERTLRNLRDCQPTLHFNVPRGLDMLLPALEADADLAAQNLIVQRSFAELLLHFRGAGQHAHDTLQAADLDELTQLLFHVVEVEAALGHLRGHLLRRHRRARCAA